MKPPDLLMIGALALGVAAVDFISQPENFPVFQAWLDTKPGPDPELTIRDCRLLLEALQQGMQVAGMMAEAEQ